MGEELRALSGGAGQSSIYAMESERGRVGSEAPETTGTITIRRKSPEDVQQRQIIVKVDGTNVGELFYGDTISVPITAGHHKLKVDNTWNWKTLELDVAAGEHLRFQTVSRAGRITWFLVSLFGAGPIYVSIEREE